MAGLANESPLATPALILMGQKGSIKEDGRVWEITRIDIRTAHLDGDYDLGWPQAQMISSTGEWNLFTVTNRSGFPLFRGRWDEKAAALDIDRFESLPGKPQKAFKGHHTDQPIADFRQFEVHIEWPSGNTVFRGEVSFSTTRRFVSVASVRRHRFGGSAVTSYISNETQSL